MALAASFVVLTVWTPWRRTVPQPSRPVILTSSLGLEKTAALSPDGTYVAYAWDGQNLANFDIYVQLIGATEAHRLTSDPAEDYCPAWSPDRTQIAFLRKYSETASAVVVVPVLGGSETKVADLISRPMSWTQGLSWSPGDRLLATVEKSSEAEPESISVISLHNGQKRRITTPPGDSWDGFPAFSPDGQSVAFVRFTAEHSQVCFADLPEAETRCLAPYAFYIWDLDWTPDGSAIVFSSGLSGDGHLARVDVSGGEPQRLAFGQDAREVSIARTGGRLIYREFRLDSDLWRTSGPEAPEIVPPARFAASSTSYDRLPRYSPDGKRVAFESYRSGRPEIWICNADGTQARQVTRTESMLGGNWTADGHHIVFTPATDESSGIFIVDDTGGPPKSLISDGFENWDPWASANSDWVYYSSKREGVPQVFKLATDGGPALQVTKNGGTLPRVTEDGKVFFMREKKIWSLSERNGTEALVLEEEISDYNWDIWDGRVIYLRNRQDRGSSIEIFDPVSGQSSTLHLLGKGTSNALGLTVSPDGQWILYTQFETIRSDLMLVEDFH